MKLWGRIDWLFLVFILLVFAVSLVLIPYLPDKVPTHWNIHGEVDGWGSKYINLFLMPGIALFIYLLMAFLPALDPFRKNYDAFAKPYQYFKIFLPIFFLLLHLFIICSSVKDIQLKANLAFGIPISLLLIFIGWIIPQLKRNFFIGIRTPWTLVSDNNWKKTHEFGGKVFMAVGLCGLVASLIGSVIGFIVVISGAIFAAFSTIIYSYLIFRKEKNIKI